MMRKDMAYPSRDDHDVKSIISNELFTDVFPKVANSRECNDLTRTRHIVLLPLGEARMKKRPGA